jgi:hypothetical protein
MPDSNLAGKAAAIVFMLKMVSAALSLFPNTTNQSYLKLFNPICVPRKYPEKKYFELLKECK